MKHMHSTYMATLKLCVAAAVAGAFPVVTAGAGTPEMSGLAASELNIRQTDRLIVKYKASRPSLKAQARVVALGKDNLSAINRAGQQFGLTMRTLRSSASGAHIMQLDRKVNVTEAAALARELMERDPSVEYAEPDRLMQKLSTPNDPRYAEQWHYFEAVGGLRADTAWDKSTGTGVTVAVLDTGYRPHRDLVGQMVQGYDFISDTFISNDGDGRDTDARDEGDAIVVGECGNGQPTRNQNSSWHGTHVAGTIGASTNNAVGVAGVAYGARILPVRVLGKCGGYTSDIADAIVWASGGSVAGVPANTNPARVINLSLGGHSACDTTSQNAINDARSRGTIVIVAAGNANTDASTSNPANCAGVVTVAATNRAGGRSFYSNYGAVVDVAAPGGETSDTVKKDGILSTLNEGTGTAGGDNYVFYQGTSMAAPHVAGVAALMLSKKSTMTPDEVESTLKSTARAFPTTCGGCGTGIVDATAAVNAVIGQTPAPSDIKMNETEANDNPATANKVTTSVTTVSGDMGTKADNDYFVVQLPPGKAVTATLKMGAPTSDFDLYIYNSAGDLLAQSQYLAGKTDIAIGKNTGVGTFARYIRVKYYSGGTGAANGKYTLTLSW